VSVLETVYDAGQVARRVTCCAREGLPKCIGDTCTHCPDCGNHSFSFYDRRCLYCTKLTKDEEPEVLPAWLMKKPRSQKQKAEMIRYCLHMKYPVPDHLT
jgi:hypothetical protein